eukprot:3365230-Amphidinium_carterae.1
MAWVYASFIEVLKLLPTADRIARRVVASFTFSTVLLEKWWQTPQRDAPHSVCLHSSRSF